MTDDSNQQPESFNLNSDDVAARKRADLKRFFPEVFNEDKVDLDQLRRVVGDWVDEGTERFGLTWPGKAACMKVIQAPATGALRPDRDESVNFDESENVFIEGDNLEVLKILQKSYFGKIKVIYIDPPYNTGGEFIYPDKFSENLDTYLAYTGQKDSDGKRFSTSSDADGRFHSRWLNMIYPRLYLARNLLRDDGVIFISIDDNEVANLRQICDQVFGGENFEGHIHWRRRHNQPNDPTKMIGLVAEHVLVYAKDKATLKEAGVGKVELTGNFSNPDNDPRGPWATKPWKVGSDQSGSRYEIKTPDGDILDEEWMGEEKTFLSLLADNRIVFPKDGKGAPRKKYFESEREEEGQCATNWWPHDTFGHNSGASSEVAAVMGRKNLFSNPKPRKLIEQLASIGNAKNDDLILDFFAGSCSTALAVQDLNQKNGSKCRFICVQLPEKLSPDNKDQADAYAFAVEGNLSPTIAGLARERLRRSLPEQIGFKAFKLAPSCFVGWDVQSDISGDDLVERMERQASNVLDCSDQDILFELLLKDGFELTTKVDEAVVAGGKAYSVADGALLICLERNLTKEIIDALADLAEANDAARIVCLDAGFQGNDQLKANAVQTFKSRLGHGEDGSMFRTV